jgi:hypothetical protein
MRHHQRIAAPVIGQVCLVTRNRSAALFVEVILTFALLFWSGALHSSDLRAGTVKPEDIALREPNWPKRTTQVSNAYANQSDMAVTPNAQG